MGVFVLDDIQNAITKIVMRMQILLPMGVLMYTEPRREFLNWR